ncbi:hypothetical protein PIB30_009815 [Stylosanthes scabra]|uniref:Uncharacterized protein n=1 Tax=Stylosanthes scabra TaxID=79078 RepID=A0ABU6Z340_9FABA|nr:hypothetical protein [Stylosanthes scabra]
MVRNSLRRTTSEQRRMGTAACGGRYTRTRDSARPVKKLYEQAKTRLPLLADFTGRTGRSRWSSGHKALHIWTLSMLDNGSLQWGNHQAVNCNELWTVPIVIMEDCFIGFSRQLVDLRQQTSSTDSVRFLSYIKLMKINKMNGELTQCGNLDFQHDVVITEMLSFKPSIDKLNKD